MDVDSENYKEGLKEIDYEGYNYTAELKLTYDNGEEESIIEIEKAGFTPTKSEFVDGLIINELAMWM